MRLINFQLFLAFIGFLLYALFLLAWPITAIWIIWHFAIKYW